jgi:putative N6-adenine-specific DNA methylase
MQLFVVCAPGLEPVLAGEMAALGFAVRQIAGGVETDGSLDQVYRANLWLRSATRVLVRLGEVRATTFAELVRKGRALPFEMAVPRGAPVAFRVTCRKSRLYHSAAVAQRLHEALEARIGAPVSVAPDDEEHGAPAQLLLARFDHDSCTVSADTSGALLHRRGYRLAQSQAPLRETLAAATLLAAGYTGTEPLLDPMCGSGTIPIEAALIARRRAPGLARSFAFQRWPAYDASLFERLLAQAREQELERAPAAIVASDRESEAIAATRENAARAGVERDLRLEVQAMRDVTASRERGLIVTNPPYGIRLRADLPRLYGDLADLVRRSGYRVAALVADRRAAQHARLPWKPLLRTQNGGVRVELLAT